MVAPFVHETAIVDNEAQIDEGVRIWHFTHVCSGARIGARSVLGQNVFVGPGVQIGSGVKIQNNVSVYAGVTVEDDVFLGPSSVFTNVLTPRAHVERKNEFAPTRVGRGVTVGANATIVCGHVLGEYALIGAGTVVINDVPPHAVVVGNRSVDERDGRRLGSVARSLIHDCPSAVWVARPVEGASPHRVLAAADLGTVGEKVVRCAVQVAGVVQTELHVVHALSLPLEVQLRGGDAEARYLSEQRQEAEQQLSAWLEGAPAVLHVGLTSPTQAVLAGARKLEPDLVVMGTVARHGLPGLVVGNTAERLLDRLEPSLLVVKPEPAPAGGES